MSPRRGPWPAGGEAQGRTLRPAIASQPHTQESLSLCVTDRDSEPVGRKGSPDVTRQVEEAPCSPAGASGPHSRSYPLGCSQDPQEKGWGLRTQGQVAGVVTVGRGRDSLDFGTTSFQPVSSLQRELREPNVLLSTPTPPAP